MHWYYWLLFPFSILFDLITQVRNLGYDKGFFKVTHAPIPSILVGNLRVGGTGKTPMVEFLIRFLSPTLKIGTLSRGYGRESKGFLIADHFSNPSKIGDEPFQIFSKFGQKIKVFVGEDRVNALRKIARSFALLDVIILDDAFQHRAVKAHLNILLTTYQEPFFDDYILPTGRLRESRSGAKRADLVVVSKCPELVSEDSKNEFRKKIRQYSGTYTPILFSKIIYGQPYAVGPQSSFTPSVILISGLANDELLIQHAKKTYDVVAIMSFDDHHSYIASDFDKLKSIRNANADREIVLLTTEKDADKLKSAVQQGFLPEIPIFAIPISVEFTTEDERILQTFIVQKVSKKL